MKIVLLGAPGSGKGTQAEKISAHFGIANISTGKIIRDEISKGTKFGEFASEIVSHGKLLPDDVMGEIVKARLSQADCTSGWVLEGYPRTLSQGEAFEKIEQAIDAVVMIEVSAEEIIDRLASRLECPKCGANYNSKYLKPKIFGICDACGGHLIKRRDDDSATVLKRIDVYNVQTAPLAEFYRNKHLLSAVRSEGGPDAVFQKIIAALEK